MWTVRAPHLYSVCVAGIAMCVSACANPPASIRAVPAFDVPAGGYVLGVEFDRSGQFIAMVTSEGLSMWDRVDSRCVEFPQPSLKLTTSIVFCPNLPLFVVGTRDENVFVLKLDGEQRQALTVRQQRSPLPDPLGRRAIYGVAITPDGSSVLAGGADGYVFIWDTGSGELLHKIEAHAARPEDREYLHRVRSGVGGLAVDPHGEWLITSGIGVVDRTLRAWDLKSGSEIAGFFPPGTEIPPPGAGSIRVSSHGHVYAAVSGELVVWEVAGRVARQTIKLVADGGGRVTSFAVDPMGTYIAIGHSDGTIAIRETAGGRVVMTIVANVRNDVGGMGVLVTALAWSPCGKWIASGSAGGLVRVWRIGR